MTAGRGQATRAPLSVELACAARAIHALAAGTALPAALAAAVPDDLPDASRAACRDIASRTVRLLGTVGALSRRLNARPPAPALEALQHVALAQLIDPVRAGHVTVDQSVRAAKSDPVLHAASGFLNATLRRFLREREALMDSLDGDDEAKYNFPAWWIQRLRAEQPARWRGILETLNRPAPMTLRVNVSRVSVADYLERLDVEGIAARRVGACALVLARAVAVETLPGWHDGHVSVQDTAAQLAAPLLDVGDGMRVLDACAAPGGKTNHLLERHDCELLALDADPARLARVHENLERLGQQARVLAGDAARPQDWWDGRQFDRILLDAPCSASGIVRRQPDVRWLRRAQDPDALGARQQRLLESLWALLRPGGKLLFCTCSIFRAEGEDVVGRFLAAQGDAVGVPLSISLPPEAPPEPLALLLPRADDACDHDGFYFALIEKRPLMLRALLLVFSMLLATVSQADERSAIRVVSASLERSIVDDEWLLSADFRIPASERLDAVLRTGATLRFVAEFELVRPRWYWLDERVVEKQQAYRLSYHLLTNRYRLDTEGYIQQFAVLDDVLRALSQLRGWAVVRASELDAGLDYVARVRLQLESEQAANSFQIGNGGNKALDIQGEWKRFTLNSPTPTSER